MTDSLSLTGWVVMDEKEKSNRFRIISFSKKKESSTILDPWVSVLGIIEAPSLLKISQKQYTFVMHLVDELSRFLDTLERNRIQARALKQKSSSNKTTNDLKLTICLTASKTFTLAVIDGLDDEIICQPAPPPSSLPEAKLEPVLRDTSDVNILIDSVTKPIPIVANTTKAEPSTSTKNLKKTKPEENLVSKGSRGSPVSSSMNMSDTSDETLSQLDTTEDLDADLDASLFLNDFEQQQQEQQVTRIELDDDCISLTGNNYVVATPLESINGVFVKLNQINVCITQNEEKIRQPFYIACNVKYLRLDEFSSLKFDTIKPKLFENERPGMMN
jgi:hypothetical protein